jgi:hypothetical protein
VRWIPDSQVVSMKRCGPCACAVIVVALLAAPGAAHAVQINGDPLVVASDEEGRLGVAYKDAPRTEFCCGSVAADGVVPTSANSGFVIVAIANDGSLRRFGSRFGNVAVTSPPVVTGTGTSADPFKLTSTWQGSTPGGTALVEIRQELVYSNGSEEFQSVYAVRNLHPGQNLRFRAATGADLAGGGTDVGRGLFQPGPPRFVGGFNFGVGSVAGLAEVTGWSHFEEGQFGPVLSRAAGDPSQGENLLDTVDQNRVDNGVAVQWDQHVGAPLTPGQSAGFEVTWRFRRTFALTPQRVDATTGDRIKFEIELSEPSGAPLAEIPIRWSVGGGPNSGSGEAETRASGRTSFEFIGANPGTDTITAYADVNKNGTRDDNEPQREALVTWTGPDAPQFGEEVNLKPVSGRVRIRLPRNARVTGKWAHAAQAGFVDLDKVEQVPVGAELDTRAGRVQLTSSIDKSADQVQTAQFYAGRFTVSQSAREEGVTQVRLTEPLTCQPNSRGKLAAAGGRRSRRLWGNGRGRFRTRGRHSTATVRGTIWLQKDSCNSTTTVVRSGSVTVRDLAKRRNVTVRRGKRYTARARKR